MFVLYWMSMVEEKLHPSEYTLFSFRDDHPLEYGAHFLKEDTAYTHLHDLFTFSSKKIYPKYV